MTAKQLKIIREKLGLTQAELAPRLGISLESLQSYEQGRRSISQPVAKLARVQAAAG